MVTASPRDLSVDEQIEFIRRGSERIIPDQAALRARIEKARSENRPLRVKLGIDPTFTDLTLGHTLSLRNLRRFQDLRHQAILIIGDYTATVGDPSGRSKERPLLTHEQVLANAATFEEQAGKIIDLDTAVVRWNSEWLRNLTLADMIRIGSHISVKRMLQGEYFGRRFDDPDQTIFMHEMFYPVMQGMDSVAIEADVELGGTDQEFNCLTGRDMQRLHGQEPQVVVTNPLLLGLTGEEKMSKSLGNFVGVNWPAQEQFNRLMAMSDDRMPSYFRLLTQTPMEEVEEKLRAIQSGEADPREAKKQLVTEIVAGFHGLPSALDAAEQYERYASLRREGGTSGELPANLPELELPVAEGPVRLTAVMVSAGLAASNGDAKRLIRQRGVRLRGETVTDEATVLDPSQLEESLLQVGSKTPVVLRAGQG